MTAGKDRHLYADVAQPKERRFGDAIAMKQVQAPPSAPWQGTFSGDASLPVLHEYISCGPQKQLVSGNWYLPLTPRCNSGWAQDPSHLSTMCPRGDICRRSSVGRAPRQEVCAGSSPAVCTTSSAVKSTITNGLPGDGRGRATETCTYGGQPQAADTQR